MIAHGSLEKLYRLLDRNLEAEQSARQSLELDQRLGQPNLEMTSLLILGKAIATQSESRHVEAESYYQQILELAE